jgi:hypothetical protein
VRLREKEKDFFVTTLNSKTMPTTTTRDEESRRRARRVRVPKSFSIIILVYSIKKSLLICKHTRAIGVAFFALFVINCCLFSASGSSHQQAFSLPLFRFVVVFRSSTMIIPRTRFLLYLASTIVSLRLSLSHSDLYYRSLTF